MFSSFLPRLFPPTPLPSLTLLFPNPFPCEILSVVLLPASHVTELHALLDMMTYHDDSRISATM